MTNRSRIEALLILVALALSSPVAAQQPAALANDGPYLPEKLKATTGLVLRSFDKRA
jgi:hypothetical protein